MSSENSPKMQFLKSQHQNSVKCLIFGTIASVNPYDNREKASKLHAAARGVRLQYLRRKPQKLYCLKNLKRHFLLYQKLHHW